ncbi:MAG: metal-dependent hydrolase, partial [Rikenellaceae bacterium]
MAVTRYNDSHLGEILLNQSARCKRLSITVLASGAVRLSYPSRISSKRALEYLREKSEWVLAAKQRVGQRRSQH